jgi:hypothetical protein
MAAKEKMTGVAGHQHSLTTEFWICWGHGPIIINLIICIWATHHHMTPSSGCNANALFQLCSGLFAIAPDCTKNGKGKAES